MGVDSDTFLTTLTYQGNCKCWKLVPIFIINILEQREELRRIKIMEIAYCFIVTVLQIHLFKGSLANMDMLETMQPFIFISQGDISSLFSLHQKCRQAACYFALFKDPADFKTVFASCFLSNLSRDFSRNPKGCVPTLFEYWRHSGLTISRWTVLLCYTKSTFDAF